MTNRNGESSDDHEEVREQNFVGDRSILDGKQFTDCAFDSCTLVYQGGLPPHFVRCDFAAPRFAFEGAAQNTVQLMSAIYNGIDERIIEKTFDEIRKGFGDG